MQVSVNYKKWTTAPEIASFAGSASASKNYIYLKHQLSVIYFRQRGLKKIYGQQGGFFSFPFLFCSGFSFQSSISFSKDNQDHLFC